MADGEPGEAPPTRLRRFAPVATRVVNPVTARFAGWMPGFALLTHRGRRSGRMYRTPLNVFRRGDQFVFVLTYGRSQWVENVLAAGECQMRHRRRDVDLVAPEIIADPALTLVPRPVRLVGRVARVTELLRMTAR